MTPPMSVVRPWRGDGKDPGRQPGVVPQPASHAESKAWQRVAIGELAVSQSPLRLMAVLGSCVAVSLYDPIAQAGGMNHILLPNSAPARDFTTRYGVQAMELLINALMGLGADRRRFLAKAFGGANVLPAFQAPTIGELNAVFVRNFLATERIPLVSEHLGGCWPLQVIFHTHSGRAFARKVTGPCLPELVQEANSWWKRIAEALLRTEDPVIF